MASMWSAIEGATTAADPSSLLHSQLAYALSTTGDDGQYWEESISPHDIRTSLAETDPSNPSNTSVFLRAMKWLLASISKGRDVSDFFPHVVKLVHISDLQIRKMVYMYLVQYANHNATTRELSLLSINSFQRGLADAEPWIRALALRVLTSILLPDILQIQILAIQKCAQDHSPYVRKCAAHALAKLAPRCGHEAAFQDVLVDILESLLRRDQATMVLSSAMVAYTEVCPDRLDLLHACFRKICHLLTDMDEWGQVVVLDVLARYCRTYFTEPAAFGQGSAEVIDRDRRVRRMVTGIDYHSANHTSSTTAATASGLTSLAEQASLAGVTLPARSVAQSPVKKKVVKGFYSDEEDEEEDDDDGDKQPSYVPSQPSVMPVAAMRKTPGDDDEDAELAADHRLLLKSSLSLLKSRNSAVVLAVCSLHYYCGVASIKVRSSMGKALVRIHRDRREIQYVVLSSIRTLATQCPSAFAPFLHDFFVKAMDPPFTRLIKLDILTSLALEPAAMEAVLKELRTYVRDVNPAFGCAAVQAVGRVAEMARIVHDRQGRKKNGVQERAQANLVALNCLAGLLTLTRTSDQPRLIGTSVTVMQSILQMLLSDAGDHGDLMNVQDPNRVQDQAMRRICVLLIYTLTRRTEKDDTEAVGDHDDDDLDLEEDKESSKLEKVGVELPSSAVSSALWMVGEYLAGQVSFGADVKTFGKFDETGRSKLRLELLLLLVRVFPDLEDNEKEQAIHFCSKLVVSKAVGATASADEGPLCEQLLAMGRLDVATDVRDRARFESNLLRVSVGLQHDLDAMDDMPSLRRKLTPHDVRAVFLQTKPASSSLPVEEEFSTQKGEVGDGFRFGTLSSLVGHRARRAYTPLPPWADKNSPSSLRDPPKELENSAGGTVSPARGNQRGFYAESDTDAESSSSSSESSDDSDSDSGDSSSSDNDDSSSSSSSDEDLLAGGKQGAPQRRQIMPSTIANGSSVAKAPKQPKVTTVQSDSESDDSDSDDSESVDSASSSDSDEKPGNGQGTQSSGIGSLIPVGAPSASHQPSFWPSGPPNGSGTTTSSIVNDMKGLVLAPTPMEDQAPTDPNVERDSSSWITLVRPDHGGGLSVKGRFVRGITKDERAALLGLPTKSATVVCLQILFENKKSAGSPSFRRLRLLQRSASSSSSAIAPRKFVLSPEISELPTGSKAECWVGMEFGSTSDRDGSLMAKLDVKHSAGGIPIEVRPSIGDMLQPCRISLADFDAAVGRLHGFQRVESKLANVDSMESLSARLRESAALTQIKAETGRLCLAGLLPASMDPVYVMVQGQKLVVCCDHALVVNSILNILQRGLQ